MPSSTPVLRGEQALGLALVSSHTSHGSNVSRLANEMIAEAAGEPQLMDLLSNGYADVDPLAKKITVDVPIAQARAFLDDNCTDRKLPPRVFTLKCGYRIRCAKEPDPWEETHVTVTSLEPFDLPSLGLIIGQVAGGSVERIYAGTAAGGTGSGGYASAVRSLKLKHGRRPIVSPGVTPVATAAAPAFTQLRRATLVTTYEAAKALPRRIAVHKLDGSVSELHLFGGPVQGCINCNRSHSTRSPCTRETAPALCH